MNKIIVCSGNTVGVVGVPKKLRFFLLVSSIRRKGISEWMMRVWN